MKAEERRDELLRRLAAGAPLAGGELAAQLGVSRQIIVQDVAALKARGCAILSTHSGYLLQAPPYAERVFKVHHTAAETEDELNLIVDNGGIVENVFVRHTVYGKVTAALHIFSRLQVRQFMEGVRTGQSTELMHITGGYHYHTVRAESEAVLERIAAALAAHGYIASEE